MNLERLRWGEWIAVIAAADLLLVTFRAWYKVSGGGARITAWDALEQGRYLLIATAVVGIFLFLMQAAEDTQRLSFQPGWIAAVVGLACTVYVAYRLSSPPSDALDPDIGLFLGLASALGVAIGGLLSAREPEPAGYEAGDVGEPGTEPLAGGEPVAETWSPAAPAPSTTGWSPAAATAPAAPPAASAGAVRPGDSVILTAGGARFPAGTVAEVVEAFPGGALVEVRAADGVAERFEVPESAYERAPAGGAAAAGAGEDWSPALPAAATEDWGFDGSRDETAGEEAGAAEPKPEKVPWWKREIGGGKKKKAEAPSGEDLAAAGAASALAGAAVESANGDGGDEKPGFFKRLFGGGSKAEPDTEAIDEPGSDAAAWGEGADTAVGEAEPGAEAAAAQPEPTASEPEATASEPDLAASEPAPPAAETPAPPVPEPAAPEPEPEPPAPEPEPEPVASEPEPDASESVPSEPESAGSASEPAPAASEPDPVASEPAAAASEPESPAAEPEPDVAAAPEPEAPGSASEPAAAAAESASLASEPPPADLAPTPDPEPAAAEPAPSEEEPPKPPRRRSSASRKVPKEVLAAAGEDAPPKVGDEIRLKVGGGKYDAGTKGRVVDVFSAGVIVELSDDTGRTERLDLPFEAIAPADA